MRKLIFQRYSRIFQHFVKIINFNTYQKYDFRITAKAFISLILRPRNGLLFPALSMLHESDKRSLFLGKKTPWKLEQLLKHADELYDDNKEEELVKFLLKNKESEEGELLWRLARALCECAEGIEEDRMKRSMMDKALEVSTRAVEKDPSNYACHKWHAIIMKQFQEFQGNMEILTQAFEIKKHFTKAIELNDKDPMLLHLMGSWCFSYAEMSWMERKISSLLFVSPPQSTFEEALAYFMDAERLQYGLSSRNYLMIAKTHLKLNNKRKAKKYLLKAMNFSTTHPEDKMGYSEAVELMKINKLDEL